MNELNNSTQHENKCKSFESEKNLRKTAVPRKQCKYIHVYTYKCILKNIIHTFAIGEIWKVFKPEKISAAKISNIDESRLPFLEALTTADKLKYQSNFRHADVCTDWVVLFLPTSTHCIHLYIYIYIYIFVALLVPVTLEMSQNIVSVVVIVVIIISIFSFSY